jgi:hypothetical protein
MLRFHGTQEESRQPSFSTTELEEAVALLRAHKTEEKRRQAESEALLAALSELGEEVSREELFEALALVRARRSTHSTRLKWDSKRRGLTIAAAAGVMIAISMFFVRSEVAPPAPAPPPLQTVSGIVMGDFDNDGRPDTFISSETGERFLEDRGLRLRIPDSRPK